MLMKGTAGSRALGIMVVSSLASGRRSWPPFADRGFYKRLSRTGAQAGIRVTIFDPLYIDWSRKLVQGYEYDPKQGSWLSVTRPIPPVIFDRCFYSGRSQYVRYARAISRLRRSRCVKALIVGLSGKWQVHQILAKHNLLRPHLPETRLLAHMEQVAEWLDLRGACILKPNAGSHGKKILRVAKLASGGYEVTGRDAINQHVHAAFDDPVSLLKWLERFIGMRRYLIQESLALHTDAGQPYDVRALMQKSGDGRWHLTGMAVRAGRIGSLTSNIHGGGSSYPLTPFLRDLFGEEETESLILKLQDLSQLIPHVIERHTGKLAELGIDFGIDRSGGLWILEVNSKPGRSIFTRLHDIRRSKASVSNLILYARYLSDRQLGGLAR